MNEFITKTIEKTINGENHYLKKQIQLQPYLIQPIYSETDFAEPVIRVKGDIHNRYKKDKDKIVIEPKQLISQFVVFFSPETKLNYKHFNIDDDLALYMTKGKHNDNYILRAYGRIEQEPVKVELEPIKPP